MSNVADSVLSYILAKDRNRAHLLDGAITDDVELRMIVQTDAISFPPISKGRDAFSGLRRLREFPRSTNYARSR